jgi:hypothetical protein
VARAQKSWGVLFDADAVIDLEDVKSRGERKALFTAVDKLCALGPDLPGPHMKSLKGEADLFELRPKQGRSPVRAIYVRCGDRFVVLAIAAKKDRFGAAVVNASARSKHHH